MAGRVADKVQLNISEKVNRQKAEREYHTAQKRWKRQMNEFEDKDFSQMSGSELKNDRDITFINYKQLVHAKTCLESYIHNEMEEKSFNENFDIIAKEFSNTIDTLNDKIDNVVSTRVQDMCTNLSNVDIVNSDTLSKHHIYGIVRDSLSNIVHNDVAVVSQASHTPYSRRGINLSNSLHVANDVTNDVANVCNANSEFSDSRSRKSRKPPRSVSSRSVNSISSYELRAERAVKAARLKTELQFFDHTREMEKLKLAKDLAITEAEIKAITEIDNEDQDQPHARIDLGLPTNKTIESFLDTQVRSVSPTEHNLNASALPIQNSSEVISISSSTVDHLHIENSTVTPVDPITRLASVLEETYAKGLPTPEPEVFKGDSMKYTTWMKSFTTFIEKKTKDPSQLLFYLERYTAGEPKDCIRGLFGLETADAYQKAKELLQERYGNPFIVATTYRRKLKDWPPIQHNDGPALRRFSDQLQCTKTAMESIQYLKLLDDPQENQKLLMKLPSSMTGRWSRLAEDSLHNLDMYPTFSTFANFIEKEARIMCNPITSQKALREESNEKKERKMSSRTTFATATSTSSRKCTLCKQNHHLGDCIKFTSMSAKEKWNFIKQNSICRGCLCEGHMKANCKDRKTCKKCKGFHPTALHDDNYRNKFDSTMSRRFSNPPDNSAVVNSINGSCCNSHSLIVPVKIFQKDNPSQVMETYAVVDDQSDACFIEESLCEDLKLKGPETNLSLSTMLGTSTILSKKMYGLVIRGVYEKEEIYLPATFSRQEIPVSRSQIPRRQSVSRWPHLHSIRQKLMPYNPYMKIGLLIGINCIKAVKPLEVLPGNDEDPYGIRTAIGWGIVGMLSEQPGEAESITNHLCRTNTEGICHFAFRTTTKEIINPQQVLSMFERDFAESPNEKTISYEDQKFLDIVEKGIHKTDDGHFEMPLPFREEDVRLPDNKHTVTKRLIGLKNKFSKNMKYMEDYKNFMNKIINNEYAEEVPENELEVNDGRVWYIPHHGVYHPKKPDKIRVVFDCSSTYLNDSLNNHLLHGPDLTNNLVGVLCRFRKDKIAFICDIEAMFFQLRVNVEHRNYLRFLWWKDGDTDNKPTVYRMRVHLFGASSSPGCANFGLKKAADQYESEYGVEAADFIRRDFYVDDGLKSVSTIEEAKSLILKSREMCERSGFRLHKYLSNTEEILDVIPPEERANGVKSFDVDHEKIERALGVQWCVENDTLRFRIELHDRPLTRRGILSTVSSVFDPLGLVSPFILTAKKLLQELCTENKDWDAEISESIRSQWTRWRTELHQLSNLQISRSFKPANFGNVKTSELHHFSDASTTGYGQCSYLKLVDIDDNVHVSLVLAKSRVAPTKMVTIPRLELTAAVVSAKIASMLNTELEYQSTPEYFWTDSRVVLGYISNEVKRFHTYVANRVQQIRNLSSPDQWYYVDTINNPADDASRGLHANELLNSKRWWNGPEFLWKVSESYPPYAIETKRSLNLDDPEVRKIVSFATHIRQRNLLDRMLKFSDWHKLKMALSVLLRLHKRKKDMFVEAAFQPSNVEDLHRAEIFILKEIQKEYFSEEINILRRLQKKESSKDRKDRKEEKTALKVSSSLYKLDVFLDEDGLIRVGGRIQNADLPTDYKHPAVLPRKTHVTELIIKAHHSKCSHQGRGITHNLIRSSGYWIIGGRSAISSIIAKCVTCKKLNGVPQVQKMSALPKDPLEPSPPFTYSAVDYFGPWYVKEGRRKVKRYGVLFTCMASRAIHLEVAHRMDTDSFLNAYRRFICRRGPVRQIRSDQGSNFKGVENELKAAMKEMDNNQISKELLKDSCDWLTLKMNFPESSHMGGSWERLIRSVRNVLVSLLHHHSEMLDDEALLTFMTEAEYVVNSRPLSTSDINDPNYPEPITPNHLLTMKCQLVLPPPGVFVRQDMYLRKRWRRVQFLANEFWKRWRQEYLQSLQPRQRWFHKVNNLKVNDIVLVKDDHLPRNLWNLGRVSETFPSGDSLTRKVKVELAPDIDQNGKRISQRKFLDRPIHKLVLILSDTEGDPGIPAKEPLY